MAPRARLELATYWLTARRYCRLSYRGVRIIQYLILKNNVTNSRVSACNLSRYNGNAIGEYESSHSKRTLTQYSYNSVPGNEY